MGKRRFSRKPPAHPDAGAVANRKSLQLCRQVERALSMALEGEVLRDLMVLSVQPAPDSSRLLVTFQHNGEATLSITDVLAALHRRQARLRSEIAASIHRRKTPELCFQVTRALG